MNINNAKQNEEGFFYKLMTVVAVAALITVIVLVASNFQAKKDSKEAGFDSLPGENTTAATAGSSLTPSDTTNPDTVGAATANSETTSPDATAEDTGNHETEPSDKQPDTSPLSAVPTEEELLAHYPGVMLEKSGEQDQAYLDAIVFLGDSTTYGLKAYAVLTSGKDTKQVWTPTNGTLTLSKATSAKIYYPDTKEEMTIASAAATAKPAMMVITLGVNGISFMDETQFKSAYIALIDAIKSASPDTKIVLQSIFPVAKEYDTSGGIDNNKINAANLWVADIAKTCSVKFLYTASVLRDEQGYLINSYQNGDYIHFNETGYKAELAYIKTHAYQ